MAYGSFGAFGPASFFTNIDLSTLIYAAFFLLVLWITFKSLSRVFPYQKTIALVLSLALSIFAVWLFSKANFNFENLLYNIGFSRELLLSIMPWILLGTMIIIIWTTGFGMLLMIFGTIFLGVGIMDLVYEKGFAIIAGIIMILIGWRFYKRKQRIKRFKSMDMNDQQDYKLKRSANRSRRWEKAKNVGKFVGKYGVGKPVKGIWGGTKWTAEKGWGLGEKGFKAARRERKIRMRAARIAGIKEKKLEKRAKQSRTKRRIFESRNRRRSLKDKSSKDYGRSGGAGF